MTKRAKKLLLQYYLTNGTLDVLWKEEQIKSVDEEAVIDEDGNIVTPEVVSYDHPYGWKSYAVDIDGDGVHSFLGLSYKRT